MARREDRLSALADEIRRDTGTDVEVLVADLGDTADLRRVERCIAQRSDLGMLVNNAGFTVAGPLAERTEDDVERMLLVNVVALARLTRAALPGMQARGSGTIINVASGLAFMQMAGTASYSGSKAFVLHFTRTLHEEVGKRGIRLQALCPGLVSSEFHRAAGVDIGRYPKEMVMSPEDLVDASLAGLELGELVCIPSLPNLNDWENLQKARGALAAFVSSDKPAKRYGVG